MRAGRLAAAARAGLVAATLALTGCQAGGDTSGSAKVTPSPPASSPPASSQPTGLGGAGGEQTSAARLPTLSTARPAPSSAGAVREVAGSCPYLSAARFADLEGDRVGRVAVLQSRPVGCRFYFEFDPRVVVGEITIAPFATATEAYNAMVESAAGHPEVQSDPAIGAGAVAFRTPLQGSRAWQCVFAKGTSVVTVRTRQPYPALNAFLLARAIAPNLK
jgi:hypothetical protein